MPAISTFEDLGIWQKAREICKRVWTLTGKGTFARDYGLKDQINRSSGSCMDNIAEGFERDGNREFNQFLSISKGSIGETRSQLYRALDRGHITQAEFDTLFYMCKDQGRDIGNFMRYLRRSGMKGNKFA
ncbi:MAG: four helix bundle protein [Flavobacteriales bacterium]|nr:four helix bundle protein [Flavobacteriales bacterium]MEB2342201.1 four helix bundle protein [Flavobacteriia bacterium]